GDRRQQRALRAVRAEGPRLPQRRERGAAAHDHARRRGADLLAAEGVPAGGAGQSGARPPPGGVAPTPAGAAPGGPPQQRPGVRAREGRCGVSAAEGETMAPTGRGARLDDMLPERASELLAARREAVAAKGAAPAKRSAAKKSPAKKKAPAKKAAARKRS